MRIPDQEWNVSWMNLPLKAYWELLSRHIRPQRLRFALLAGLLLVSIGLQIINPQIMRAFIDAALGGVALNQLYLAALAFIGIALLQQVAAVSVTYLGEKVAWTATNELRAELAWHCLDLDMGFHSDHTPGELIERIDGDVTEMATFFSQFIVTMLGNLLLVVGVVGVLFRENWRVGLVFALFAAVTLATLNRVRNIAVPHQKARRQAEARLFGFVEEQLSGAEDIRSSGAVNFSMRELVRLQSVILRHDRNAHRKGWMINNLIGAFMTFGLLLAVASGYSLFIGGAVTVGTVYLVIYYLNLLQDPIWAMTRQVESFQTIGACVERLTELSNIQSRLRDGDRTDLAESPPSLLFDHVQFAYPGGEPVFEDLHFHLKPGKVLGLLGRTGSGKTTLARLVFRLYDPQQGRIALAGLDLRQARLQALHGQVGIVTQDVQLFRATIRDNLTFFDLSISDQQIEAAILALELQDWYGALPDGLDTRLEAGGHSLSAGEAQLLAFTRIFLRSPGLVILDEASSRLDPATEQRIERAMDKLLQNRTTIIIAHRLETLHRADEVMILDHGQIIEHGDRRQLAGDPASRFFQLLQTGMEEVLV
jgi:ABC-type multidrug transport system fused ATPase/permease subunit